MKGKKQLQTINKKIWNAKEKAVLSCKQPFLCIADLVCLSVYETQLSKLDTKK